MASTVVKSFLALLFVAGAASTFGPTHAAIPPQSENESEIRAVVERFFAAFQSKDMAAIAAHWAGDSKEREAPLHKLEAAFAAVGEIELKSLSVTGITLDGDKATVRVSVEITAADVKTEKPAQGFGSVRRVFHLTREGGAWKISRYLSFEEDLAARVAEATTKAERRALLDANTESFTIELDQALKAEGVRLGEQSRHSEAIDLFQLALYVAIQAGDKAGQAASLRNIGAGYALEGNYTQAVEYARKTIVVAEELSNKHLIAYELFVIGLAYYATGNYAAALDSLRESLTICEETSDKGAKADVLLEMAACYSGQSNHYEAMKYLVQGLKLAGDLGDERRQAAFLRDIGAILFKQGNTARSLEYFRRALDLAEKTKDVWKLPSILDLMGNAEHALGNFKEALECYERSLKIAQEMNSMELASDALDNIGLVRAAQKDFTGAIEYFQRSLRLDEQIGSKEKMSNAWHGIGEAYNEEGKYAEAVDAAERAITIARQVGAPDILYAGLTTAGTAYRGLNQPDRARSAFVEAIAAIERMREQEAGGEQERQSYVQAGLDSAYDGLVALLVDEHDYSEALHSAERVKARVLLDVLESGRLSVTKAMTAAEVERERKIDSDLASLNSQVIQERVSSHPERDHLAQLEAQLAKARFDREAFESGIYAVHPELRARRGQFQAATPKECGALIPDPASALLEFMVSDHQTYLFVLTKKTATQEAPDLKAYKIDIKRSDLASLTETFREEISVRDVAFNRSTAQLYDLLLRPAAGELDGKTNLVIIPDGPLWELPFQALRSGENHFLIVDHSISYAPSLTALREMTKRGPAKTGNNTPITLLAMGNPAIGAKRSSEIKEVLMDADLQPLPQAEEQVRALGSLYGKAHSAVYVGAAATEDTLKTEASKYRILHLAAHGILNDSDPMYSQIVLSREKDSPNDGLLEAWEVMNLDLKTELVVLAGCETARGRLGTGEGIIGLSWAFFVAGSTATMVSQWNVDAESTTKLMVEFHQNLRTGMSKAEALRRAEISLLKNKKYSHPFYWAPFVIIGAADPIR
jgi:CHAT domain-containing protein/tetratricopeptide (TPR) repeat protein